MKYMVGAMIKATVQLVGLQQNYLRLWSRLPLFVVFFFALYLGGHEASKKSLSLAGAGRGGRELNQIKAARLCPLIAVGGKPNLSRNLTAN